jgi:predicted NAD/FAD-dependent oxidoreductase
MLAFEEAPVSSFDGIFCNEGPLRWAARNDSKPGRRGHVWALHANPAWSEANLEATPEAVLAELVPALEELLEAKLPALQWAYAHRWLYALVEHGLEVGCLWDPELRIGACGDWANRARVEGAYLSGTALADRVLADL